MHTLDLSALRVESFATADQLVLDAEETSAGTLWCMSHCGASCPGTCAQTCPATCNVSCLNTECVTACQGGGGTGTAVETCWHCTETEGTGLYPDWP